MDSALSSPRSSQNSLGISEAPTPELDISDLPDLVPDVPTNVSLPARGRRVRTRDMTVNINVVGKADTKINADRANLRITIYNVSQDISDSKETTCAKANKLESILKRLSTSTTKPPPAAPASSSRSTARANSSNTPDNTSGISWHISHPSANTYVSWAIRNLPTQESSSQRDLTPKVFSSMITMDITFTPNPDFSALSSLWAELLSEKDCDIVSYTWSLADSTKAKCLSQLRSEALQVAKSEAQEFARASGCGGAVRLVEISVPDALQVFPKKVDIPSRDIVEKTGKTTRSMRVGAVDFEPPQLEVTCEVHVKYEAGFD